MSPSNARCPMSVREDSCPLIFLLSLLLLTCLAAAGCSAAPAPVAAPAGRPDCSRMGSIDEAFQCARQDPNALRAFLLAMPKGGDLHHHLTGAIYPEVLLQLASYGGLGVDVSPDASGSPKFAFKAASTPGSGQPDMAALTANCLACPASQSPETCAGTGVIPACCLCSSSTLYDGAVNALSMRGLPWGTLQAHDHFFAIFGKLGPVTGNRTALLAQLRQQASRENVLYLETMSSAPLPPADDPALAALKSLFAGGSSSPGAAFCAQLMADSFGTPDENGAQVIAAARALGAEVARTMAQQIMDSSRLLGCGSAAGASAPPGCEVTVRHQIEMHRTAPPLVVCQEALLGFATSEADRQHVVGINIVAAEDAYVSRIDYSKHMNLIGHLGTLFRPAGRALHAGELIEGLVPPNDLRFHIHDAVAVAHAQRIGHGVAITYETGAGETLKRMAEEPIAVEINLVSNAQLLGIEGDAHPLPLYVERHVPVVLATDDPGIMRTTLTEQYRLAALDYPRFRYADLRTFNRNSLEYSFLTGPSIWEDPGHYEHPVADCRASGGGLDLSRCETWAKNHGDKAQAQVRFERRLWEFEEGYRR
jgi:adenosine deaminase